ncbi:MAG: hypothetical protein U1E05_07205, partial [Patescibacteria group bacterium]|nr:hypothetical protein [Patescibacteria group bacterium]
MNSPCHRLPTRRALTVPWFLAVYSLAVVAPASAATFNWTGAGADSNWSTAANWAGLLPTSASDTIIVF